MKIIIMAILITTSITTFAKDCAELAAFAENKGVMKFCVDSPVVVFKTNEDMFFEGTIVSVKQTVSEYNRETKIIIRSKKGFEQEVSHRNIFFKEGCQLYSVNEGWNSKVLCVGESIGQIRIIPRTNQTSHEIEPREIFAVGFEHVLLLNNNIIERGYNLSK